MFKGVYHTLWRVASGFYFNLFFMLIWLIFIFIFLFDYMFDEFCFHEKLLMLHLYGMMEVDWKLGEIWLRWYQMKEIGAYCETSLILISIKLSNWIYFWTDEAEGLKYLIFVTLQVGWMLTPISLHSLVLQ